VNYTHEEKVAHIERARVYVGAGKGSYSSYAREAGVPRTTFHKWLHDLFPDENKKTSTSKPNLVNLGKPVIPGTINGTFVVDYYGAKITVKTTHDLVELLKSIKKASIIS
jgi:hypothetical protein